MAPNVILYDFTESICCQMTRMVLAEKGVSYTKRNVDISEAANEQFEPWYTALNPKAVVPTLEVDGEVICDTLTITPYIDANFDGPTLLPADEEEAVRAWMRDVMAPHYGVLLYAPLTDEDGVCKTIVARGQKLAEMLEDYPESREVLERRIKGNARFQEVLADRERSTKYVDQCRALVERMDAALAEQTFLVGPTFTIADAFAAAALARFDSHGFASWWEGGVSPNVERYYLALQDRPSWNEAGIVKDMDYHG